MLTKASAITSELRTDPRVEAGERAGSTGGLGRTLIIVGLACLGLPGPAQAQSFISGWGGQVFDSRWSDEAFVEIAAGRLHTVARRSNGSVVAGGDNTYGQCNVPTLPAGLAYVEVAASDFFTVARCAPSAAVVYVGTGGGGAGLPVFGCNAPRIGQNVTFSLTQGTPNASGFIYYSGVPAAPIVLGSGCTVEMDLATFSTLLPVVADSSGSWATTVGLPMDPALVGLHAAMQVALFGTAGPFGFDLSNGLVATIGC